MKKKVIIIGPIFNSASGPTGQGGALYTNLNKINFIVIKVSSFKNKILRSIDTLFSTVYYKNRYDVILLQSFGLLAFYMEDIVSRIAKIFNKPIVFTIRGGAFYDFFLKYPMWVRKVLGRGTVVNSPSFFLIEKLKKEGFRIEYMPNAIKLESFPYNREHVLPYSILWVRAFHDIYNPELAIEALNILKKDFKSVKLTMIGPDQGLLHKCKDLIKKYNLQNDVIILGYIPNSELYKYYQTHQVFLTTTRYESFGVAIVEAGSCGIPCVSVSVGEIPYIWENQVNILLADRDPKDFADKISIIFNNKNIESKLSLNARKNSEKYNWDNVLPMWVELINRITIK
jgi:glycosyltransferase involved in cell wall biosynthesis